MKHLIVAVSLLFLLSTTIILSKNNSNSGEISFFSDNIEALSNVENSRQIVCDNFSLTMICQKTCVCGATWQTSQGYGHATKISGTCVCGRTW